MTEIHASQPMKHQPETRSETPSETNYLKKSLSDFSALKLQFTLIPLEKIHLGPDEVKGDRWRGGFGEAFRKLACAFRLEKVDCNKCDTTAHALHGKARKLIYRSPVTEDVVIFDHSPC